VVHAVQDGRVAAAAFRFQGVEKLLFAELVDWQDVFDAGAENCRSGVGQVLVLRRLVEWCSCDAAGLALDELREPPMLWALQVRSSSAHEPMMLYCQMGHDAQEPGWALAF
jgi:hypothetical protein